MDVFSTCRVFRVTLSNILHFCHFVNSLVISNGCLALQISTYPKRKSAYTNKQRKRKTNKANARNDIQFFVCLSLAFVPIGLISIFRCFSVFSSSSSFFGLFSFFFIHLLPADVFASLFVLSQRNSRSKKWNFNFENWFLLRFDEINKRMIAAAHFRANQTDSNETNCFVIPFDEFIAMQLNANKKSEEEEEKMLKKEKEKDNWNDWKAITSYKVFPLYFLLLLLQTAHCCNWKWLGVAQNKKKKKLRHSPSE